MAPNLDPGYKIDVHTHPAPFDFWRQSLIDAGFPIKGVGATETVFTDGFPTPKIDEATYIENRAKFGYDFSLLSIPAPAVQHVKDALEAAKLARKCNEELHRLSQTYPSKIGAAVCVPLPDVQRAIEEVRYCLDDLGFEAVSLMTNYEGLYLGHSHFDELFSELNRREATVIVHPVAPTVEVSIPHTGSPMFEYPADTTRAVMNYLFQQGCNKFPNVKLVWSHGGGMVPFLAERITLMGSLPFMSGRKPAETMGELRSFYFDLAAATSPAQLATLRKFTSPSQFVLGSDFPYYPEALMSITEGQLAEGDFTEDELRNIRHGNALKLFPGIAKKLEALQD